MSAESPIRTQSRSSLGNNTVLPQQVTDPTILDSVAGFINDVVPTAYTVPSDSKDQIQWARFEHIDNDELNHCTHNFDCDNILPVSILLVLGYTTGIQVWAIPANGEAKEILSWRHGSVRVLRILPTPQIVGNSSVDIYASKRPIIALCDNVTPGTDYCSVSFISLRTSEQVKLIKFKNPILDVVANRRSVVVTFLERIAVFDAFTLDDRLTVTTCYLSPGIYPNPIALGTRWLAYAENKLNPCRRSSGGNDGEGVQSYTATVLHAAKSLGRGLRELGETVASSLTGNTQHKPGLVTTNHITGQNDVQQKGVVTIIDVESPNIDHTEKTIQTEAMIAHFTAHTEAIVCLSFDPSGLLLLTADKRGHDFHLFRVHPHPGGPALAAVHHLYVLHRGDTTARVQDMCFSPDSRWVTVSTIRGTTHVFPITPYGGNVGFRTHATPHVVNKMSRFHRSAGLTAEGRSNSPVCLFEAPVNSNLPYNNPRLPPYPHPTIVQPLAQIRQPLFIQNSTTQQRQTIGRQRLSSSSEENIQVALRVSSCFAPARAWIEPITQTREPQLVTKPQIKPVESLFVMSCHGSLVQYDLEPHHVSGVPKEKVCDDTSIVLNVFAKAQWILQRQSSGKDIQLPLSVDHLLLVYKDEPAFKSNKPDHTDDRWLSQVEIVTHAGPHRRLWMGPQFTFKTYNNGTGAPLNILEAQSIDVVRSKPVNMPLSAAYPILIEAGSVSSCEPSPKLLDTLQRNFDDVGGAGEIQLREDLADAMLESPGVRDTGGRCVIVSMKHHNTGVAKVVNPLGMVVTIQSDDDDEIEPPEEIIHENCDEALFRPVVASKAVLYAEPKNVQSKIATNVLHVNKTFPSDNKLLLRKTENENINKNESSVNTAIIKKTRESPPKTATSNKTLVEMAADTGKSTSKKSKKIITETENEVKVVKNKSREVKIRESKESLISLTENETNTMKKSKDTQKLGNKVSKAKTEDLFDKNIEEDECFVESDLVNKIETMNNSESDQFKTKPVEAMKTKKSSKFRKNEEFVVTAESKSEQEINKSKEFEPTKMRKPLKSNTSEDFVEIIEIHEEEPIETKEIELIRSKEPDQVKPKKITKSKRTEEVFIDADIESINSKEEPIKNEPIKLKRSAKSKKTEEPVFDVEIIETKEVEIIEPARSYKSNKVLKSKVNDGISLDVEAESVHAELPEFDPIIKLESFKKEEEPVRRKKSLKSKVEENFVEPIINFNEVEYEKSDPVNEEVPLKMKKSSKSKKYDEMILEPEIIHIMEEDPSDREAMEPITVKEVVKPKKPKTYEGKNKNVNQKDSKTKLYLFPDTEPPELFPALTEKKTFISPEPLDNFDYVLPKSEINKNEAVVETLHHQIFDTPIPREQLEFVNKFFANSEYQENKLEDFPITSSTDVFEAAPKRKPLKNDRYQSLDSKDMVSSSEDNEEKQITTKKPRKPKTKLGVRIVANKKVEDASDLKFSAKYEDSVLEVGKGVSEDMVPIKSWSSVASRKIDPIVGLPEIESVESFTMDLPKVSYSTALKEPLDYSDLLRPEKSWNKLEPPTDDLLKIDKSSDDEKQGTSSQETTESSDDSSKIPPAITMDIDEDAQIEISKPKQILNKSKKPKKKKR